MVLFTPVVVIGLTFGVLSLTTGLVVGRITPVVFLELYLVDLVVFLGFGYVVYRVTLRLVRNRLPESLDALETEDSDDERLESAEDR